MHRQALKKSVGQRVRIRPIAKRFDGGPGGPELPQQITLRYPKLTLTKPHAVNNVGDMPLPLVALAFGALASRATAKKPKKKAVSGYRTKKGKKVKAYLKNDD
jgi:hypothetical protein